MNKPKNILFYLNYLYYLPTLEPIIKIFTSDTSYNVAISLSHDFDYKFGIFRRKKTKEYLNRFIIKNVRIAQKDEKFDVVFVSDVIEDSKFKNSLICMVYHGPLINKSVTFRELRKHKDDKYLIFAESQYAADRLIDADCLGSSKTEIVGFPKMDPIINDKYEKNKILTQFGLDANKKTVLYAPTYKPTSLYELKDEIFNATEDYNLIIKLHHYSWMGKYANRNQSRIINKRVSQYDHAALIPRDLYNIIPLYAVADTLISEASGAILEFLITNKVGIIYDLKDNKLKHTDDKPLLLHGDKFLNKSFIHINSPSQLKGAIHSALNPSQDRIDNIKQDKKKYFNHCDGMASNRIKKIIDDILSKDVNINSV
ncbi:CDP-glycerol glycerophosphotransferase family protein [Candidatus Neomarinimicrobiota bacterium]